MENLYENIKKFRELKSITREQMASDLGMSLSNYSKIERGEIDLTISRAEQIAQVLGVDLSQIMDFDVSQIFNVNNNKINYLQGLGAKAENMHFYGDDYKEKYIRMLEAENVRLTKIIEENK